MVKTVSKGKIGKTGSKGKVSAAPVGSSVGSQEAYERFLPAAQALPDADVIEFRADAQLAYHNVLLGSQEVLGAEARIKKELPAVKLAELRELPELALGVVFAALQVNRDVRSSGTIASLLKQAQPLRRTLLSAAVALADAALVPRAEVDKILQGHGKLDAAKDCVALAALHRKYAAKTRGKTPVTAAQITQAASVGSTLLTLLKPAGAPRGRKPSDPGAQAAAIRNRLWTLLVNRHALLWRVGAWLWGPAVEARVPALQSRDLPRKKPAHPPQPPAAAR